MIGDKLIIKAKHRNAAQGILDLILPDIQKTQGRFAITIAGESGSGKSETAEALTEKLGERGIESAILQQDDYFIHPPITNDQMRRADINWVGTNEVKLDLMDKHLRETIEGKDKIVKPLVIYQEDSITEETLSLQGVKVIIAEGTYTTTLKNAQTRVFIDLTYKETKKTRLERAREEQDDFLERVLKIEHEIISAHKDKADIIVTPEFAVELKSL